MALAFLYTILTLLLATVAVQAAPTEKGRRQLSPGDIIKALSAGFVSEIHAFITAETLDTNLITVNFDIKNPAPLDFNLLSMNTSVGLNGTIYATFQHTFPDCGLAVPSLGSLNSGTIPNVLLTKGALASLDIIPFAVLDVIDADIIINIAGTNFTLDGLTQSNVPTTYDLSTLEFKNFQL